MTIEIKISRSPGPEDKSAFVAVHSVDENKHVTVQNVTELKSDDIFETVIFDGQELHIFEGELPVNEQVDDTPSSEEEKQEVQEIASEVADEMQETDLVQLLRDKAEAVRDASPFKMQAAASDAIETFLMVAGDFVSLNRDLTARVKVLEESIKVPG